MIVCVCKRISDKTIKEFIENGISDFRHLQAHCAVGSGCGKCIRFVEQMIEKRRGLLSVKSCDRRQAIERN